MAGTRAEADFSRRCRSETRSAALGHGKRGALRARPDRNLAVSQFAGELVPQPLTSVGGPELKERRKQLVPRIQLAVGQSLDEHPIFIAVELGSPLFEAIDRGNVVIDLTELLLQLDDLGIELLDETRR